MDDDFNREVAQAIIGHAAAELAMLVDDDRAVSILLTAALQVLTGTGMDRETAAEHLHLHASALHQAEVDKLVADGLLVT